MNKIILSILLSCAFMAVASEGVHQASPNIHSPASLKTYAENLLHQLKSRPLIKETLEGLKTSWAAELPNKLAGNKLPYARVKEFAHNNADSFMEKGITFTANKEVLKKQLSFRNFTVSDLSLEKINVTPEGITSHYTYTIVTLINPGPHPIDLQILYPEEDFKATLRNNIINQIEFLESLAQSCAILKHVWASFNADEFVQITSILKKRKENLLNHLDTDAFETLYNELEHAHKQLEKSLMTFLKNKEYEKAYSGMSSDSESDSDTE